MENAPATLMREIDPFRAMQEIQFRTAAAAEGPIAMHRDGGSANRPKYEKYCNVEDLMLGDQFGLESEKRF